MCVILFINIFPGLETIHHTEGAQGFLYQMNEYIYIEKNNIYVIHVFLPSGIPLNLPNNY